LIAKIYGKDPNSRIYSWKSFYCKFHCKGQILKGTSITAYMTTMIAIVLPVILVSLLITSSFEKDLKTQAMASQNSNSSPSTNNNNINGSLTIGPPQLPLSDKPIHGPIPGTQAP
jgi:choline-glycine betaine transporter